MERLCSGLWPWRLCIQTHDAQVAYVHRYIVSPSVRPALNLSFWQALCFLKLCHFTFHKLLFETYRSTHSCSRKGKYSNLIWKWIWFHGRTFGWYSVYFKRTLLARNVGLTLSQVKSDVVWTEIFWSSLSKEFLRLVFFPWQTLCTGVQTRSSGLFWTWNLRLSLDCTIPAHTHTHTHRLLNIPGTLTHSLWLHISFIYWNRTQLVLWPFLYLYYAEQACSFRQGCCSFPFLTVIYTWTLLPVFCFIPQSREGV